MNWFFAHKQKIVKVGFLILLLIIINGGVFLLFKEALKSPSETLLKTPTSGAQIAKENKPVDTKRGFSDALSDCKSNSNPEFSADITLLSKISHITPPVSVQNNDLITHAYTHLKPDSNKKVPVYVPVEAIFYEGSFYSQGGGLYSLFFEVSCEVRFMFDHIAEPVEKIQNEFSQSPASDSRTNRVGPINFTAGEIIGYVGFTDASKNWDFGVYNSAEKNPYRDSQFEGSDTYRYSNAVCPYTYFSEKQKESYKKFFTDSYGVTYKSDTNLCADL